MEEEKEERESEKEAEEDREEEEEDVEEDEEIEGKGESPKKVSILNQDFLLLMGIYLNSEGIMWNIDFEYTKHQNHLNIAKNKI